MIEFGSRLSKLLVRASERLYGIQIREGNFAALAESYSGLIANAESSLHLAFPYLPPEFFTDPSTLQVIQSLLEKGGGVEVITLEGQKEESKEGLEALRETGSAVYLSRKDKRFNPFTLIDERHAILHSQSDLSGTWEQVFIKDATMVGPSVRNYLDLRDNSTLCL